MQNAEDFVLEQNRRRQHGVQARSNHARKPPKQLVHVALEDHRLSAFDDVPDHSPSQPDATTLLAPLGEYAEDVFVDERTRFQIDDAYCDAVERDQPSDLMREPLIDLADVEGRSDDPADLSQ